MKKLLIASLFSLLATTVYADGGKNLINITGNMFGPWYLGASSPQNFNSYQFNDLTNQTMRFHMAVDSRSAYPVWIYCLNKGNTITFEGAVAPGTSMDCTASDAIKLSEQTQFPLQSTYIGTYSLTLANSK